MKARLVLLAALTLSLLSLLSATAHATPLRLWHAYRGNEEKALEAILATWKGAPVETLAVPYDAFATKLAAAIPLGEGPDLYIDSHERLGDYRARRIVGPVGDALEPGVFSPPALEAVSAEGAVWALPLSQKCLALYLNTDLVKEAPEALEDLANLRAGLPAGTYPLAYEINHVYGLAALFSSFGGRLLDEQDGYGFVGPAAEQTLLFARGLVDQRVMPGDVDGALVTNLFKSGQAAYAVSGPWLAADLGAGTTVKWRVAPLPKLRATGQPMRPLLTVESVILSPQGAAKAEARALAKLIAGADAARIRAQLGPTPTARLDVAIGDGDAPVQVFARQAKLAIPMPSSRAMRAVWDPADRAILKVLRRDATPDVALAEGKRRFDDVRRPLPQRASPVPALLLVGVLGLYLAFHWFKRSREEGWAAQLEQSLPSYRYVAHAVIAVGVLVIVPLVIGAVTSLFAGSDEQRRYVGLANFINILTARGGPLLASGSFYLVLLVTLLWTVTNIVLHVGIGAALALLLSRPTLRFRAAYRVLLIIPWAVPSYVTALAWKGMFHRQFGAVTGLILGINRLFGTSVEPIAWFSRFSTAFIANLTTNVWLGFPFMMVVTMGALTAVPDDVLEAARVDGATRFQRLRLVTLPIIRPTLAPAVTLGAIWTFNMFNVVFLVSGGDPDGTTDILVSEAYRWAFTRENQYGYAAAYAVLIFLMLFLTTRTRTAKKNATEIIATPKAPAEVV
jgi:arabinogalactan oligomer/maltooligosaccharide transport system permease protein